MSRVDADSPLGECRCSQRRESKHAQMRRKQALATRTARAATKSVRAELRQVKEQLDEARRQLDDIFRGRSKSRGRLGRELSEDGYAQQSLGGSCRSAAYTYNSLGSGDGSSLQTCIASCDSRTGCHAISFYPGYCFLETDYAYTHTQPEWQCWEKVPSTPVPTPPTPAPTPAPTPVPTPAANWSTINATAACEENNEGITRTHGLGAGYTLNSCKDACVTTSGCVAIDFYTDSGWCNLFDTACSTPIRTVDGASSYAIIQAIATTELTTTTDGTTTTEPASATTATAITQNPSESQRSYSSVYNNDPVGIGFARSMLNSLQAWSACSGNVGEWMQIDLGMSTSVAGVVTQGRYFHDQWVSSYNVCHSQDGSAWSCMGSTFSGNADANTAVNADFNQAVWARYVRLLPQVWNGYISMRAALLTYSHTAPSYVFADDQAYSCPLNYGPVGLSACSTGLIIGGVQYVGATANYCHTVSVWPSGCFAFGTQLYYSTCIGQPLSIPNHVGVCQLQSTTTSSATSITSRTGTLTSSFTNTATIATSTGTMTSTTFTSSSSLTSSTATSTTTPHTTTETTSITSETFTFTSRTNTDTSTLTSTLSTTSLTSSASSVTTTSDTSATLTITTTTLTATVTSVSLTQVSVSVSLHLQVAHPQSFISDSSVKSSLVRGMAEVTNVPADLIDIRLSEILPRRLEKMLLKDRNERRLSEGGGNVLADFRIGSSGTSIAQAVRTTSPSDMQAIMVSHMPPDSHSMNLTQVRDPEVRSSAVMPIRCSPGTHSSDGYPPCYDCPEGEFSEVHGSRTCNECESGTYAGQAGSSICDPCALGSTSSARASSCDDCELGRFRDEDHRSCQDCSPGRYTNGTRSSECVMCPPGTYNGFRGGLDVIDCLPCGPGTFQSGRGSSVCINCERGKFSSLDRQTECLQCGRKNGHSPDGSTTQDVATRDERNCVCSGGEYYLLVTTGFRGVGRGACASCPAGLECPGGRRDGNLSLSHHPPRQAKSVSAGKALSDNAEPLWVVECENTIKCPGGTDLGTCPPNRQPGPGCDQCMVDYYENSEGECVPCGTGSRLVPLLVIFLCMLLLVAAAYAYALTTLGVSSSALRTLTSVTSITLTTAQVLGAFNQILIEWPNPLQDILKFMQAMRLSVEFVRPGCVVRENRPEIMYLGSSTSHLCFATALTLVVCMSKILRLGPKVSFDHLFKSQGMLIMAVYTTLCVSSLLPWQCAENPDKTSSVATSRGVVCWTVAHSVMIATSVGLVAVYVVGWLSIVTWATIVYPKKILQRDGSKFATRFHFLFFRYKPTVYWYGLVSSIRGLLIAAGPILLVNYMALQLMYMVCVVNVTAMIVQRCGPWRVLWINALDGSLSLALTLILIGAALVQETSHAEAVATTSVVFYCMTSLIGASIILIFAATCYRVLVPRKLYSVFLCYHGHGDAVLARWFKMALTDAGVGKVFLDRDSTASSDEKVKKVGCDSEHFVMFLTSAILRSDQHAAQIATAVLHKLKIVSITCTEYVRPERNFFDTLEDLWSVDKQVAMRVLGIDIALIRRAYLEIDDLPVFQLNRYLSIASHDHLVRQVTGELKDGGVGTQSCLHCLQSVKRHGLRRSQAMSCFMDDDSNNNAERYSCRIVLICNVEDPESKLLGHVLRRWLQNAMQEAVNVAEDPGLSLADVRTVIAVIQRGTLEGTGFAAQAVAAAEHGEEHTLQIISVIGDPAFECPDMKYWNQLANGRKLDMSAQVLQHVSLRQVIHAYKLLFDQTSLRLSPQAPEYVQMQEVQDVCNHLAMIESGRVSRANTASSVGSQREKKASLARQASALDHELARSQSENGGISVAFVTSSEFRDLGIEKSGKQDPSFYDLKDPFFKGDAAVGRDTICPRDGRPGCALIDYFVNHRGECTDFMSWTWGYKVSMLADALALWTRQSNLKPETVFLYCCFFVNNQYRILVEGSGAGSDNLEVIFETRLNKIGRVVAVLDTWDNPRYLTRVWTIFEQFTATKLGLPVTITLPQESANSLMAELDKGKDGIAKVTKVFRGIDSEASEAFMNADEEKVKGLIRETIGFKEVNHAVAENMVNWVAHVVHDRFSSYLDDDHDATSVSLSHIDTTQIQSL